jgi:hypothetical protein
VLRNRDLGYNGDFPQSAYPTMPPIRTEHNTVSYCSPYKLDKAATAETRACSLTDMPSAAAVAPLATTYEPKSSPNPKGVTHARFEDSRHHWIGPRGRLNEHVGTATKKLWFGGRLKLTEYVNAVTPRANTDFSVRQPAH